MVVVYYRMEAKVNDTRIFKDGKEFGDWLAFAAKYEPIIIVGIYDRETPFRVIEKDIDFVREKVKEG